MRMGNLHKLVFHFVIKNSSFTSYFISISFLQHLLVRFVDGRNTKVRRKQPSAGENVKEKLFLTRKHTWHTPVEH